MSTQPVTGFRLSPIQRRLWPGVAGATDLRVELLLALRDRIDPHRLQDAAAALARDYEILRTSFRDAGGQIVQCVSDSATLHVRLLDAPGMRADRLWTWLRLAGRPADAAGGSPAADEPLCDVAVVSAADGQYIHVSLSPLAADRRSARLLVRELLARASTDPPGRRAHASPLQYADIAEWKQVLLASDEAEAGRRFWQAKARDTAARPSDPSAPSGRATRSAGGGPRFAPARRGRVLTVPAPLRAPDRFATVEAIALGCWVCACARILDEPRVVMGVVSDGRVEAETQAALGPMTTTLPLAIAIDPAEPVSRVAARLAGELHEARVWQDVFDAPSCGPLLFEWVDERDETTRDPRWTICEQRADVDRYEVKLVGLHGPDGIAVQIDYDRDAIDEGAASQLLAVFDALFERALMNAGHPTAGIADGAAAIATQADAALNDAALTPDAGARAMGAADVDTASSAMHGTFEQRARATPDALAVSDDDGQVTYGELNRRADRLARALRAHGLQPEDHVGILVSPSCALVVAVLGVLKAGGAFVPLDGAAPQRLRDIVHTCRIRIILTEDDDIGLPAEADVRLVSPSARGAAWDMPASDAAASTLAIRHAQVDGAQLAYVLFTSGSTGMPKGVMVPHAAATNYLSWACAAYDRPDTIGSLVHTPLDFDFTLTSIFVPLMCGRVVWFGRGPGIALAGQALTLGAGLTFLKLTPSHLRSLRYTALPPAPATRLLVVGGEALRVADLACLADDDAVVNEYGPTEAAVGCCVHRASVAQLRRTPDADVPIGRPIANTRLHVLADDGTLAWPGARGELAIGGRGLARGYLRRADLTAASFRPDAHGPAPGARVYRTGDDVRLRPDGLLAFLGRRDTQIKLHGFRIELDEIAHAACRLPTVAESAAILTPAPHGDDRIALCVRLRPGAVFDEELLRAGLAEHLPAHMRPATIVQVEAIPLTAHGKVDRQALGRRLPAARTGDGAMRVPATPTEQALAAIWRTVLRIDTVGAADNFFAAGGDSIRAIQVLGLARQRGYDLSLQDLLAAPTIAGLAERVGGAGDARMPPEARRAFALVSDDDRARLPADLDDAYPMVSMQEGMLFHSEWDEQTARYHDIVGVHLQAPYDRAWLLDCLRDVVAAHPVLRTVFDLQRFSEPMQLVRRHADVDIEEQDLRSATADEQRVWLDDWLATERRRKFAWSETPPYRFSVQRRGPGAFQFNVSFHHALLDGWSTATLLSELVQRYAAPDGRPRDAATAAGSRFRDYVFLERAARRADEPRAFWRDYLAHVSPTRYGRDLPPASAAASRGGRRHERPIPPEIHAGLSAFANRLGVPLRTVLLAAHVAVTTRLTNSAEIVTGLITSGRVDEVGGEQALGLCLNTLPFRAAIGGGSWRALVRALYENEARCAPHRRFPVAEILRTAGAADLFDVAFNFVHYHLYRDRPLPAGIQVLGTMAFEETSFALLASFVQSAGGDRLTLLLDADVDRVPPERLPAIADLYENALRAVVERPDASARACDILSARDAARLRAWSQPARSADAPAPRTVVRAERRVLEQARRTPDRVALVSDGAQITYRTLAARARRVAGWLGRHGIGAEQVVALDMARGADLMVMCLGTVLAGAAYTYVDGSLPDVRRHFILRDCEPGLIVTDRSAPSYAAEAVAPIWPVGRLLSDALRVSAPAPALAAMTELDSPCYLVYTSGSTGQPKAIVMPHRPVAALVEWQLNGPVRSDLRTLQFTTLGFDVSYQEIFATLGAGGTLVLMGEALVGDAPRTWDLLRDEQVERLYASCPALRQILAAREPAGGGDPSVRRDRLPLVQLLIAGSVLQLTPDLRAFFADHPELAMTNQYGPAETHVATWFTPEGPSETWQTLPSLGRPVAGAFVHLLDEQQRPLPIGSIGEICIGGDALARGYRNRPDLTAARFVPDPQAAVDGARLYRSGDSGRLDEEGLLEFLGRRDHQVKVLGHRVELGEIEAVIARAPDIAEAAVEYVAGTDGEGRLIAYIVPRGDAETARAQLRMHLQRELPRYMTPSSLVTLEALPKTIAGKIDRTRLPRGAETAERRRRPATPATAIEAAVLALWAHALQSADVDLEDDFFEAGGHSLTATRIVVGLRARFQIDLPIKVVFQLRTVRALAGHIADQLAGRQAPAPPGVRTVPRDATLRLARQQAAFWFFEHVSGQINPNNIHVGLRFDGLLRVEAVAEAASALRARHEALRTAFVVREDGEPMPVIAPPDAPGARLVTVDLSALDPPARARMLDRVSRDERDRPFDLTRGDLCRFTLVRLGAPEHVLLFTTHHLVCDGWSIDILTREFSALYAAGVNGTPAGLPPLPFQYVDFVEWQHDWLAGPRAADQIAYWRHRLRPPLPDLLPVAPEADTPHVAVRGRVSFTIPPALAAAARRLAHDEHCTLFAVLLTIWKIVLARHANQPDIRVATYASARGLAGTEHIVGLFSNVVCLRSRVEPDLPCRDLLHAVQSTIEEAAANADVPFDTVSRACRDAHGAAASRPYQVLVLWHAMPASSLQLPGIDASLYRPEEEEFVLMHAPLDLKFEVIETPAALSGCISYTLGRFSPGDIQGFVDAFERGLLAATGDPARRVSAIVEGGA